jgi:proton glutamate symport protein
MKLDPSKTPEKNKKFLSLSMTAWIFIAMIAGVIIGHFFPASGVALRPYGRMFVTMIKGIIAPLVFATLVVGISGAGDMKTVGRIGFKSIVYFEIATTFALFIGLGAAHIIQPGHGINIAATTAAQMPGMTIQDLNSMKHQSLGETIQHLFTPSIVDSMAKGDILQIVIFTTIFSLGVIAIGKKAKPIIDLCEALSEVMFKFTAYIMLFAPFGVGCAIAAAVGEHGLSVLINLAKLILTFYGSLIVFLLFILLPVTFIIRLPLKKFIEAIKEPVVIAFSTTSSEAALPKAMIAMEKLGVPKSIVGFVIPTGYSFNLDGTTMYLSLASLFIAQAAGVHMTFTQQVIMMLTLMITSKGVAGVPRAALVILTATLSSFHLPVEGVLVILGVDEIMDMARTSVNVIGNCLASAVVAKWENSKLNFNDDLSCLQHQSLTEAINPEQSAVAPSLSPDFTA